MKALVVSRVWAQGVVKVSDWNCRLLFGELCGRIGLYALMGCRG